MRTAAFFLTLALATGTAAGPLLADGLAADDVAKAPRISVDRMEHDFGPARQLAEIKTEFKVSNTGTAPLHATAAGNCGCAQASLADREIAPGAATVLTVVFHTERFVGPQVKRVTITSDDPDRKNVDLVLHVDVSAGIVVTPQNFFFNTVLLGSSPTASVDVKWKDGVGKPFKILSLETTGVQPPGAALEFETKPLEAPPWHGYTVTLKFKEPPPLGLLTGTALVRTDDPDYPRLQMLVGCNVSGRVQVALLKPSFGVVSFGKGGQLSVRIRPFDATIDLGEVTAKSTKGRVEATAVKDEKAKGEWLLEIRLPKDAPEGTIDDVVEVKTGVKGEETISLPVSGTVMPKPS